LADQNIVTNITATANFSSLTAQLQAVTQQLLKLQATTIGLNKNLTSQVGVMNRQFDETMRSTGQFSRHFVTLTSDVSKFGQNLDSGRMKLGQYFRTWQGHTQKTSSLVRDLAKQQVMLENAIIQPIGKNAQGLMQYNVMVQSGLDVTKNKSALLRQELSIMNKVMMDGSNQLINWGKNTQWAGRQLTVGLTVPLAAFGMAAAKAFRQADEELVRLTKVYGGLTATSSADLLKVRKDVMAVSRELASGLGANFTETIALAADIAATGKQGADLLDSTRQTTRLAILGEVDRQEAMKATLSIQTAFGQNTMELAESIDFLNAVENQTSTTLDDLVTAIPKAGPVVKALGGDVQDLALYLTAMREGGINASEGANALKSALASVINPTKVAKEMFMGFGIDLSGIVNKNAGNLTGTIMALKDSLDSLEPLQRARAIEQLFGKFQFARINALFENLGKEGSQTLQVLDLMKASTQELASISARELTALTESASGKYRRALESVKADLAVVGEQFLKVGAFVLNAIDGIIKFIGNMPGPIKAVLGFIGSLTAIAGPIIMLTGVLANFFGYIVKGILALKNIGKGGTGFKLLTPELMAASAAAKTVEQSFYSDTKAAATFSDAVMTLSAAFDKLKNSAMSATVATSNSMSTVGGNPVLAGGGRIVDKNNPLVGRAYSRDMSHMIPTGSKTPQQRADETIFSTVPGPKPVNQRISNSAQVYMDTDLPKIPGVTSVNGVSTGVVAGEAAKWHSMTAAIAMQSKAELAMLKQEVAATGTVTASLSDSYQALLPQMTKITSLAAKETEMIVNQLQAGKITVEAARSKIFALNAQVEAMMVQTAQGVATAQARTLSLTTVPLTTQPVVSAAGKSNMKELFHKTETAKMVDVIARSLGVRTSGAGYSMQTTVPRRLNSGGMVYDPSKHGSIVPGPSNIDYDMVPARLPEGSYILNQAASRNNPELVAMASNGYNRGGKVIDAILTPKETYFDPEFTAANKPLLDKANSGSRVQLRNNGGMVGGIVTRGIRNYGKMQDMFDGPSRGLSELNQASAYIDLLTGANSPYTDHIVPNLIQNDAAAILQHSKDPNMTPTKAVEIAERAVRDSLESHKEYLRTGKGMSYVESQRAFMEKNFPQLVLRRKSGQTDKEWKEARSKASPSDNRSKLAVLNVLKSRFPGAVINPGWDRAHIERMSGPIAARGYFGEAAHDDFNRFGNRLQQRGIIDDVVPLTKEEALARAHKLSTSLGFKDVNDFKQNIPVIEKWIATGRWTGKGPIPESLVKALGADMKVFRSSGTPAKTKKASRPMFAMIRGRRVALANSGGMIGGMVKNGKYGYGKLFLGMPRSFKAVEQQRKARLDMEEINASLQTSRFAALPPTDFGRLISPTSGRSFPVPGIGGVYEKPDGTKVFVKPVLDETAALAEQRATIIARDAHLLHAPTQEIRTMIDPTDPTGKRRLIVLESPYDEAFAKKSGTFNREDYFKQLVASTLRGDRDLSRDNLYGSTLADVGTAGVFKMASGKRTFEENMTSMKEQARINLLGVKGGAKRFFAESTLDIPKGMKPSQYHQAMIDEIDAVLPRLRSTIARFDLNEDEARAYAAMIRRLEDGRRVNWQEFHGIHSSVEVAKAKALTPAALKKLKDEAELRIRQKGHAISLSDNSFKTPLNGFNGGGVIGNVLKGLAMKRIGAGFGPTGAPKPSMYESAPWGVNSLSIKMAETLFAGTGLRKNTQKLLYDKFAAAMAKEKPFGYVKGPDGSLRNALEPDSLDSVIRMAASQLISDRQAFMQLSPIDRDILKKKYVNFDSKKDTPITDDLKKKIFGIDGKREMGGPVSPGQNYLVGEKGPEIFSPQQSGKIIPGFMLGGIVKSSKIGYGENVTDVSQVTSREHANRLLKSGNPSQRAIGQAYLNSIKVAPMPVAPATPKPGPLSVGTASFVGQKGVVTNAPVLQGSLPYAPGIGMFNPMLNKPMELLRSASKQIEMSLYALGTSIKKDAIGIGKTLKFSRDHLALGARMYAADLKSSINTLSTGFKSVGTIVSNVVKQTAGQIGTAAKEASARLNALRQSLFSPQIIASRPPGAIFNPSYKDRSGNIVPASRADNAIRRSFAANAMYSTTAMLNPIQFTQALRGRQKPLLTPEQMAEKRESGAQVRGMAASMGGMMAGGAIGEKVGGQTGMMAGSIVGSMAAPMLMAKAGTAFAGLSTAMGGAGFAATAAAAAGLVAPLAAVTVAVIAGYKAWKNYKEGQRLNISTFGMTAEAAKKANLRFTDFGARIKDTIQDSKDMAAANKMVYESMKDGGTPFQMTIEEYRKLKVEVKETFGEQIKALNRQPSNKVPDAVRRIKEQLIAAGMSAEEATKKIYTMLQLSNKSDQSITATMGNNSFKKITDAQTSAVSAVESFGRDTADQGPAEKAASLNTALMATETGINDLIEKRERLVAKDTTGKIKSLSYSEAEKIMLDQINKSKLAGVKITKETVDEMAKTNPAVRKMINGSDTVVSVWQKIRLEAQGFNGDLSLLTASQTDLIAKSFAAISQSVTATNRTGILKEQYDALDKLDKQIKNYTKALKGQSVAEQISDRDRVKALNKQIDAINKLAEARKKALQAQQADADLGRQIEKTRLEMQNAASVGDTAKEQSLRIDLESLTSQQQTDAQMRAIDAAAEAGMKPLKAAIEAISNKQEKLSDSAALAGESLDKLKTRYDKQEAAIKKVNDAMTALYGNASAAGLAIEDYIKTVAGEKEAAGLVAATESATGVKMPRYTRGADGKPVPVSPQQNALDLLLKSGTGAGANAALAAAIGGGATLLDVVNAINGDFKTNSSGKKAGNNVDRVGGPTGNQVTTNPRTGDKEVLKPGVFETSLLKFKNNGRGLAAGSIVQVGVGKGIDAVVTDDITKPKKSGELKIVAVDLAQMRAQFTVHKAQGGVIRGPGTNTSDSIPAMLSDGEFVVNAKSAMSFGYGNLDQINRMAMGGRASRFNFNRETFDVRNAGNSGSSYVVNQTIYASDGMDVEALSNMIVRKAEVVIGQKAKINVKMVGQGKNI
jgi:TP901 family phage tail tape measure protein